MTGLASCPACGEPNEVPRCLACGTQLWAEADTLTGEARTLGEQGQTLADQDQTSSDQDQTWSDHDQTASESDQRSADEDQHAADDDLAAGGDMLTHRRSALARERSTRDRAFVSAERDETAATRLKTADERDRAAALRDLAAAVLDEVSRRHDLEDAAHPAEVLQRARNDRKRAAADRVKAAEDRARAAADRREAARERADALKQRTDAAHDLEAATIDELTGAWTRRLGLEEVSRELERARRTGTSLVLAFLDVDGLKEINDGEGHLAGDAVLQLVGETLRANVRPYDVTVRYGGDELVCAMSHISASEVRARFEKVSAALAAASPTYSVTVGLAELEPEDDLQGLLARADADLLEARARRTGRR